MSRLPRLLRTMHTGSRQIPHPATPSTSPSPHGHLPHNSSPPPQTDLSLSHPSTSLLPPQHNSTPPKPKRFNDKGRPISSRPRRTIPVTLPSGRIEPPSYPPPEEYFRMIADQKDREEKNGLKVPRAHQLWSFFHVPVLPTQDLDAGVKVVPDMGSLEVAANIEDDVAKGRSWAVEELRVKSFEDLHKLWYVLLRERNVLATQKEERRRLGIRSDEGGDIVSVRALRCRKSMSRIKYVLNERRLAILADTLPLINKQSPAPIVPSTISGINDPMSAVQALHEEYFPPIDTRTVTAALGVEAAEQESVADEQESVVVDGLVGKEEVESRDEGWGGGREAKEFVEEVQVDEDGKVGKA